MTLEEYEIKLKELQKEFEEAKKKLHIEYAHANNPYKEGDIFTDHIGSILIKKIGVYVSGDKASCSYTGIELKKDGSPMKKQSNRKAYQINEVKQNNNANK
jgi:hypothetical protein